MAPLPKLYFDTGRNGYWLEIAGSRFLFHSTQQATEELRHAGLYSGKVDTGLNPCEQALRVARLERYVDFAGPLAGHRCGVFQTADGRRVLVTSEPAGVFERSKAEPDCPKLERFLDDLFGPVQLPYVLGWLKCARASLMAGDFTPGQMLALAGESNCGKSFFQALVTEFLGGRMAKPYRYMTGQTAFNSDLAGAEHLMIEDECASTNIVVRRAFGTAIKDYTVNATQSIHAKGRPAVTLTTFKRITLSVNCEAENLAILPPLDSSLADKIILLKCSPAKLSEDRKVNWERLAGELPHLAAFLQRWRIPKAIACPRFGVQAYQNPELLETLNELSPEFRLLALIDHCLSVFPWTGSAEQLEHELRDYERGSFRFSIERLLPYPSACGTYLGRLAAKLPDRVSSTRSKGKTRWRIHAATEADP